MNEKVYFKGLNELRFFAALLVLLWHSNRIITPDGFDYNPVWFFLSQNGTNAVNFFFVLSGFLISYLLITEFEKTGTVVVKIFYIKRVLRIWPLYYLIIVLVQFILPFIFQLANQPYKQISGLSTFFYLIILPNIPYAFSMGIGKIGHLWSIGVEEQFYLIWAPIVKAMKKKFVAICFFIVVLKFVLYYVLLQIEIHYSSETTKGISLLISLFGIEKMAIGGIGAYYLFYFKDKLMSSFLFSAPMQMVVMGLLLLHLCINETIFTTPFFHDLYDYTIGAPFFFMIVVPALFLYLILNVSVNTKCILRIENKALNYLGTISFGLYMYHMIAIFTAEFMLSKSGFELGTIAYGITFFILAFTLNVLMSALSYKYIESKILKFRPV